MFNKFRTFAGLVFFLVGSANLRAETVRTPGVIDGFRTTDNDRVVDAALVLPSLGAADVIRFDMASLLGPGERAKAGPISTEVPGNTFIPRQREKYGWINITLEKEEFGFYSEAGVQNELNALWFSAPWDLMVDAAKGNAKPTDLLKAAKFRKAGFAALRDWTRETKIFLSLDRDLLSLGQLKWTRGPGKPGQADMVVAFQQTPIGRWALASFSGNPAEVIALTSLQSLGVRTKVLGVRSTFKGKDLVAAEGWIVDAERDSKVVFTGVPSPLTGVALAVTAKKISWKNPGASGWMGVIHQPQSPKVLVQNPPSIFEGLIPLENPFANVLPKPGARSSIAWVAPGDQVAALPATFKMGDQITLVYVGTSKDVPLPRADELEPEIFTFAESIRTVVVK